MTSKLLICGTRSHKCPPSFYSSRYKSARRLLFLSWLERLDESVLWDLRYHILHTIPDPRNITLGKRQGGGQTVEGGHIQRGD